MTGQFRALGGARLRIAFRNGPYDWEAPEALAGEIARPGLSPGARNGTLPRRRPRPAAEIVGAL